MLHRHSDERDLAPEIAEEQDIQQNAPAQATSNAGTAARAGAVRQLRAEQSGGGQETAANETHNCGPGCGHGQLAAAPAATEAKGDRLPGPVQAKMEQSFGADFSGVRVSEGESARDVGALAYTQGNNIQFAPGQYDPSSRSGQELIGHELTHVVQQRAGRVDTPQAKGAPINADQGLEQEADLQGQRAAAGLDASVTGAAPDTQLQRKEAPEKEQKTSPEVEEEVAKDEKKEDAEKKFSVGDKVAAFFGVGKVIKVGKEKVRVYSEEEEKEAPKLINEIKDKYGITISSTATVQAIKNQYGKVPDSVKDKLKTMEWEFKELKAVHKALSHYAPILGESRKNSTRKDDDQEVTSIGKVKQAIDSNSTKGELDTTTLGEYFSGDKNFGMFKAGTNSTVDFKDSVKQLEATAVHEMAHGLMANEYNNFVKSGSDGFWLDQTTKSGKSGAEVPPTSYGKKNAREDLAESVMYYFVEEATLKSNCPKRHAFIAKVVASWTVDDDKKKQENQPKKIAKGSCG